jgi:hypothetical protein
LALLVTIKFSLTEGTCPPLGLERTVCAAVEATAPNTRSAKLAAVIARKDFI